MILNLSGPELAGLLIALVLGLTFHEFSHAYVADQLGDHRPRALGRVSLNPLHHLDPVGSIFMLIAGFGWAKPVPVNAYALRPGRIGLTMVALAGPLANFAVALVFALVFRLLQAAGLLDGDVPRLIGLSIVYFNVALGILNLIPIPPLDGYNVILPLLAPRQAFLVQRYAQYGYLALLALVLLSYGSSGGPLQWLFGAAAAIARLLTGA
jgi:Zn-dependent protease